ncbi:MAG: transcriptional regulator GcvA [Myxococcales bacterium]|nr:transcriptional regulator GcvA [Myxococcales bacterium]MDD9964724.1 transcriptional regulator GcvA [Myxococcales bacterium]
MSRELPSLNALRAFEAAARLGSFTRGARELNVTQAAVSHQVRALEQALGINLFVRRPRALELTPAGQRYRLSVTDAFDRIHAATRELLARPERTLLTVSVLPSFAARWLVPRLGRFNQAHPDVDLRIAPTQELADFSGDGIDIAIRYGRGRYPGLLATRLLDDELFPVCSPGLLDSQPRLRDADDLAAHTLLHDENHDDWKRWLLAADAGHVDAERGPVFSDASMLIQAAVDGQGVGMARRVLVSHELTAGRLIRPFDGRGLASDFAYYVVYPRAAARRAPIRAFRAWLRSEVTRDSG